MESERVLDTSKDVVDFNKLINKLSVDWVIWEDDLVALSKKYRENLTETINISWDNLEKLAVSLNISKNSWLKDVFKALDNKSEYNPVWTDIVWTLRKYENEIFDKKKELTPAIFAIQWWLEKLWYLAKEQVDWVFRWWTKDALQKFQIDYNSDNNTNIWTNWQPWPKTMKALIGKLENSPIAELVSKEKELVTPPVEKVFIRKEKEKVKISPNVDKTEIIQEPETQKPVILFKNPDIKKRPPFEEDPELLEKIIEVPIPLKGKEDIKDVRKIIWKEWYNEGLLIWDINKYTEIVKAKGLENNPEKQFELLRLVMDNYLVHDWSRNRILLDALKNLKWELEKNKLSSSDLLFDSINYFINKLENPIK